MGSVTRNILIILAAIACVLALAAAPAAASVTADCNDNGSIDGRYSPSQLKNALRNLPADLDQYSDCRSLIQQALLDSFSKKDKKSGPGSNDSATLAQAVSNDDREAVDKQVSRAARLPTEGAVAKFANVNINRSGARTLASSASPGVPATPLIALIGLLLLLAAGPAGRLAKRPALRKILPTSGRGGGARR